MQLGGNLKNKGLTPSAAASFGQPCDLPIFTTPTAGSQRFRGQKPDAIGWIVPKLPTGRAVKGQKSAPVEHTHNQHASLPPQVARMADRVEMYSRTESIACPLDGERLQHVPSSHHP